jgi:hypothetical protein
MCKYSTSITLNRTKYDICGACSPIMHGEAEQYIQNLVRKSERIRSIGSSRQTFLFVYLLVCFTMFYLILNSVELYY